jgi:hypothetical protein
MTKGKKDLERLQHKCTAGLEKYIATAKRTCELMGSESATLSAERRNSILLQRRKENAAHDAYQKARLDLLNYLTGTRGGL